MLAVWVGFGYQIWCQLLTHLSRAAEDSLVVVDEPEVYLHPASASSQAVFAYTGTG